MSAPVDSRRDQAVSAATYYALRRFYLDQLDARDKGGTQEWLDVFDDDATLTTKVLGHGSSVTKAEFAPAMWELDATFRERGIQRRHCVSGFTLTRRGDRYFSRFYGLFLTIDAERGAVVRSAALIRDTLRRSGSTWRVISREIERDDLGRLNGTTSPLTAEGN